MHLSRTTPDAGWATIAPFFAMHEVNAYGTWMAEAGTGAAGGYVPAADAESLRATGQYRVITPEEMVVELKAKGPFGFAALHPLMGGIPPEVAWESFAASSSTRCSPTCEPRRVPRPLSNPTSTHRQGGHWHGAMSRREDTGGRSHRGRWPCPWPTP